MLDEDKSAGRRIPAEVVDARDDLEVAGVRLDVPDEALLYDDQTAGWAEIAQQFVADSCPSLADKYHFCEDLILR